MKWVILILLGVYVVTHTKVTTKNTTVKKLEKVVCSSQKKLSNSIINVDTVLGNVDVSNFINGNRK